MGILGFFGIGLPPELPNESVGVGDKILYSFKSWSSRENPWWHTGYIHATAGSTVMIGPCEKSRSFAQWYNDNEVRLRVIHE